MKIQCSCGAKFAFDVTPEMVEHPIRFVCPSCGLDSSEYVNGLIRQQFAGVAPGSAPAPEPSRLELQRPAPAVAAAEPVVERAAETPLCSKHPGQRATERCRVCHKPICAKCMELFGFVCSPRCKAKAEAQGIAMPRFAGQRSVVEARQWRWIGLAAGWVAILLVLALGFWFWYAWIGSVPKTVFSVRFSDSAYAGDVALTGGNQIVFLHGGTLARHDLDSKVQVWSRELIDPKQLADSVARTIQGMQASKNRMAFDNPDAADRIKIPGSIKLQEMAQRSAEEALKLYVVGQNIWVASPGMLTRYDWGSGRPVREVPLGGVAGAMSLEGKDLVWTTFAQGVAAGVTFDLENGQSNIEPLAKSRGLAGAAASSAAASSQAPSEGLPLGEAAAAGNAMDPNKVAEQAQNLTVPAKIALPAILANSLHQERIAAEAEDRPRRAPAAGAARNLPIEHFSLVNGPSGYVQLGVRMLEAKFVQRKAMKDAPGKSVLDGNITAAQSSEFANETLNEMQRSRGGDTVTEDLSRYQVVVRQPKHPEVADWTGEVVGPPSLFPLKTVNVVTGGKTLVVLDDKNRKLWQSDLVYPIGEVGNSEGASFGAGPCVERGDTLYVFDQAVLTAFDLKSGNARWRLPSVGIVGLCFDDKGMLYVNTTTASPEKLKYSRQIDVNEQVRSIILKVDPATGKALWTADPGGFVEYLSGKYLYVVESHDAGEAEQDPNLSGLVIPSHVSIRRLNLSNGHVLWEHTQRRAPLSVHFDENKIELVFKKEVQLLRFVSL